MKSFARAATTKELEGRVYCFICTHTVPAQVVAAGKATRVKMGQKCRRCSASLDAGYVLTSQVAA